MAALGRACGKYTLPKQRSGYCHDHLQEKHNSCMKIQCWEQSNLAERPIIYYCKQSLTIQSDLPRTEVCVLTVMCQSLLQRRGRIRLRFESDHIVGDWERQLYCLDQNLTRSLRTTTANRHKLADSSEEDEETERILKAQSVCTCWAVLLAPCWLCPLPRPWCWPPPVLPRCWPDCRYTTTADWGRCRSHTQVKHMRIYNTTNWW